MIRGPAGIPAPSEGRKDETDFARLCCIRVSYRQLRESYTDADASAAHRDTSATNAGTDRDARPANGNTDSTYRYTSSTDGNRNKTTITIAGVGIAGRAARAKIQSIRWNGTWRIVLSCRDQARANDRADALGGRRSIRLGGGCILVAKPRHQRQDAESEKISLARSVLVSGDVERKIVRGVHVHLSRL